MTLGLDPVLVLRTGCHGCAGPLALSTIDRASGGIPILFGLRLAFAERA